MDELKCKKITPGDSFFLSDDLAKLNNIFCLLIELHYNPISIDCHREREREGYVSEQQDEREKLFGCLTQLASDRPFHVLLKPGIAFVIGKRNG